LIILKELTVKDLTLITNLNLKKNILITGSNGFVGRNVIPFLSGFGNLKIDALSRDQIQRKYFQNLNLTNSVLLHLAGKAHDLKNNSLAIEYYQVNTELTKELLDVFLNSKASVFITLSSVKAVADTIDFDLTEEHIPNPTTHYGRSKLLAEKYILSKELPQGKRVYILRPCMIHGPGNQGNLNLLYKLVSRGIPWPLGAYENMRSFCSIDNLMFIIKELIDCKNIPSGVYNIADDEALSTNEVISILAESQDREPKIWKVSKDIIKSIAKVGDVFHLPLTTERLQKLTESYVVSNQKIKAVIGKDLPVCARDGLLKTFNSFHKNA
jgi:nucleoside-diphosphate-sugar epimerase